MLVACVECELGTQADDFWMVGVPVESAQTLAELVQRAGGVAAPVADIAEREREPGPKQPTSRLRRESVNPVAIVPCDLFGEVEPMDIGKEAEDQSGAAEKFARKVSAFRPSFV